jgi:NADPH:quinone reductase-like Zn-dependent oxidoreductase
MAWTGSGRCGEGARIVFDHLASGEFKPRIDKTFPLTKIVEAHRYMESNAQTGKIVVVV